jgi:hypothetical protein
MFQTETFDENDGIKIYSGITKTEKDTIDISTEHYRSRSDVILKPMNISVITAAGQLKNLPSIDIDKIVDYLNFPKDPRICAIRNNFGCIYPPDALINKQRPPPKKLPDGCNDAIAIGINKWLNNVYPPYTEEEYKLAETYYELKDAEVREKREKAIKKGKLPKPKNNKRRRRAVGAGNVFNSCIQFTILDCELGDMKACPIPEWKRYILEEHGKVKKIKKKDLLKYKCYKIKVFNNGTLGIPGVLKEDFADCYRTLGIMGRYLSYEFQIDDIAVDYMYTNMRNYKCMVVDNKNKLDLTQLKEICLNHRDSSEVAFKKLTSLKFPPHLTRQMAQFGSNTIKLTDAQYNIEKFQALLLKFHRPKMRVKRPMPENQITIKIPKSGKIGFDGSSSRDAVTELYYWVQYMLSKNRDTMVDMSLAIEESSDDDSESTDYD